MFKLVHIFFGRKYSNHNVILLCEELHDQKYAKNIIFWSNFYHPKGPLIKITRSQEKPILKKCILSKIDLQQNFNTKLCSKLLKLIITIYRTLHFELYEPLFQTSTSCLHLNKIADMVWNELDQIDQVMDPRQ